MTARSQEHQDRPGRRTPDIEITDADFPPQERIEIGEDYFNATPSQPVDSDAERGFAKVLGLKGRVTREDVRRAYRDLAGQYHPDKVQHLGPKLRQVADNEMRAINEAYSFFKERWSHERG